VKGSKTFKIRPLQLKQTQRLNVHALNRMNQKYANHYRYTDHDPVLDMIATVVEESGQNANQIAQHCGASPSTVRNYLLRVTKNPRNSIVDALFRSYGYYRPLMRLKNGAK
jgi:hypothetical protein